MSLLQSIEGMMMPDIVDRIGTKYGLDGNVVKGGVGSLTKDIVGGLSSKTRDPAKMGALADLVNEAPDEREDVGRAIDDDTSPMRRRGSKLLSIATDDQGGLATHVTRSMGLAGGAATGMLATVAALVMGGLRKFGAGRHLDASSLGTTLRAETGSLAKTGEVVTNNAAGAPEHERGTAHTATDLGVHHRRTGLWWLLALIPLIAIAIWVGYRGREHTRTPAQVEARRPPPTMQTHPTTPTPPPAVAPSGEAPNAQAPNAQAPSAPAPNARANTYPAGSGEQALLTNLRSPNPNDTWITLDNARFDTGSSALDPASTTQLAHVAEVLKTYPNARIRIGGYTDATGTPDANMQLSQARAEAVKQAIVANGVDASRIDTEAFGQTRPVEPTTGSSDANRRVAIQVTGR